MRAIRINPYTEKVTEFDFDGSDYKNMYKELTFESHKVDCFQMINMGPGVNAYIDESGALPHHNPSHHWKCPSTDWITGMAIVLGETEDDWGDLPEMKLWISFDDFESNIIFDGIRNPDFKLPSSKMEIHSFDDVESMMGFLKDIR